MAREVYRVARSLQDVAEDDLIDLLWVDLGTLERGFRRDHSEVCRGDVAQPTAESSKGGSRAVDDHDVLHCRAPCPRGAVRSIVALAEPPNRTAAEDDRRSPPRSRD